MTELIVWMLLVVADGQPRAFGFNEAAKCQEAVVALSHEPAVTQMSECTEIRLKSVAPSDKQLVK